MSARRSGRLTSPVDARRRVPIGAEVDHSGGVHFRVWAPRRRRVEVVLEPRASERGEPAVPLVPEGNGYFSGRLDAAGAGSLYRFSLDGALTLVPDPASRFQPEGPHGPSRVVDPAAFRWTDGPWRGVARDGQVLYEMHVGTFTPEGTWAAASRRLPELRALGVTIVEMMPVGEFPGRFGWGYDGVDLFAPTRLYGEPDDFRRFVDAAHAAGLGVILDVVYNHLGPDGNYMKEYSESYFTDRYPNEWGEAINFDGEQSGPVREFYIANASYWIDEFHLDGLRLDATQSIHDRSSPHVLAQITTAAREAARGRTILIIAENEPQQARLLRPVADDGHGADAAWNDDFHHSAMVALTGRSEAYYRDHRGSPQELISAAKWGYLFQGQFYGWQGQRRGTPVLDTPPAAFVVYLQNHDQIANSAEGARAHRLASPARYRAMTALLLLSPQTPLLFQGQEFGASAPFLFFADHRPELAAKVRTGRAEFLRQFPSLALPEVQAGLADPSDPATFERCKLDWRERETNAATHRLHQDLLALRRAEPVLQAPAIRGADGAVLGSTALLLRYFGAGGADRLLVVNLGSDRALQCVPEPLLAPPEGARWRMIFSSADPRYGGGGTPPVETAEGRWCLPAETAVFLRPEPWRTGG